MWRPKDWENPYREGLYTPNYLKEEILDTGKGIVQRRGQSYEYGADAMLEALRKEALVIVRQAGANKDDVITWTVPKLFTDCIVKGVLVFIPDEGGE